MGTSDPAGIVFDSSRFAFPTGMHLLHLCRRTAAAPLPASAHAAAFRIVLPSEGLHAVQLDGQPYRLAGGSALVVPPGHPFGTGANMQNRGRLWWLAVVRPNRVRGFLRLMPRERRALAQRLAGIPCRPFPVAERTRQHLAACAARAQAGDDPLRQAHLEALLVQFLVELVDAAQAAPAATMSRPVRIGMDEIRRRLCEPRLRLQDIATAAGVSLSRFKALFRAETGIAPGSYINVCKVERARWLLRTTNRPITDIALALGFSSSQYFATVFRAHTNRSPSAVREQATPAP